MLKTIAIAGVSAAGGLYISNYVTGYLAKETTTLDNNILNSTERKAMFQQGVAAGTGVGLFVALNRIF